MNSFRARNSLFRASHLTTEPREIPHLGEERGQGANVILECFELFTRHVLAPADSIGIVPDLRT